MVTTLRKWWAVFEISFQESLAYRASMLIWIMTDVVPAVTMPLVWASASRHGLIAGFGTGDFVLYYLCILLIGCFVTSHMMWDLAMEIKEGQFSTMLIRPISYFHMCFFRNISWRIIRVGIFLPFFLAILFLYRSYVTGMHLNLGLEFWAAVLLGHVLSFVFVMAMAMLALFTQEATSIFELYYVPMLFLSGQLFPIAVLPGWARNIAVIFPFYYTTGAPTEILIGRIAPGAVPMILGKQLLWIAFSYVAFRLLWRRGIREYTGVGM